MWETHLSGSMRGPWRTTFMVATQVLLYWPDGLRDSPRRIDRASAKCPVPVRQEKPGWGGRACCDARKPHDGTLQDRPAR